MIRRLLSFVAVTLAVAGASCATQPHLPEEIQNTLAEPGLETIVILGTNDLHGALGPLKLKSKEADPSQSVTYEAGGATLLASYVRILREQFGPRLIWLDGGDEFQGSIESNIQKGAPMVTFFNQTGLNAAAIGNHEFDFGPETEGTSDVLGALKARMREAKYPYLAANVFDKATGKLADLPNTFPSKMMTIGNIKIGVIGLSTQDTPRTTRGDYVKDLSFGDLREATIREAGKLRFEGANVIVVTSHVGIKCGSGPAYDGVALRKPTDRQSPCGADDEMVKLLRSLPEGTVDAVVAGHSHQIVHHWVAGVPVVEGGAFARYFNLIYLTLDRRSGKLLRDRTRIEGPIPVCAAVFRNQGDCDGDRPAGEKGRGSLVTPVFHGKRIQIDDATQAVLAPAFAAAEQAKKRVVGKAARMIEHERFKESPLGNLVADSLRAAGKADVALVNSGGIRAPIPEGEVTYGDVFRSLPFDNLVSTIKLTGKQLKLLLRVAESGSRGFPSVSGLRLKLVDTSVDAPATDLNGDRRIETWEVDRLLRAEVLRNGQWETVKDDRTYVLATIDFLANGGDDLGWVMAQIPKDRFQLDHGIVMRDAFIQHIATLKDLNSAAQPLIDPANPRLVFEKTTRKSGKAKGKRSGNRRKRR